jgi:hypothetical protein
VWGRLLEVAPRKRVAISTRSQLHACCQVETRRDATLVEMRREVRAVCDRSAGNCYINPAEPCYIVLTQRFNQNIKQRSSTRVRGSAPTTEEYQTVMRIMVPAPKTMP